MEGKRFIHKIKLQNFLSYGSEGEEIELQPLNVLIGANTSGKSNLIEALGILRATPTDLPAAFRQEGGVSEFLWKGDKDTPAAEIIAIVDYPEGTQPFSYNLKFTATEKRLNLIDEARKNKLSSIALYRGWDTAQISEIKRPQKSDLPEHPLLEDGSNLGLFLKYLQYQIGNKLVIENLKKLYDAAEELNVKVDGDTVRIFIREEGLDNPISAHRLSSGTLRYLFLMALLLDPNPPPLICLEAPEIGLHPDILPTIAEMLIEASQRTQLIVTTYSDTLISALGEYPESILVCERDEKGSHLRRLEPNQLKDWLEKYTLGDLWRMGEIGGNRW